MCIQFISLKQKFEQYILIKNMQIQGRNNAGSLLISIEKPKRGKGNLFKSNLHPEVESFIFPVKIGLNLHLPSLLLGNLLRNRVFPPRLLRPRLWIMYLRSECRRLLGRRQVPVPRYVVIAMLLAQIIRWSLIENSFEVIRSFAEF